jgi:hypothetical protein
MREVGVDIPRTVREQATVGEKISTRHMMPGDLVFFDSDRGRHGLDHVGIYMGGGWFTHSTSPVGVVHQKLDDYDHNVKLARRVMHERTGSYADKNPERNEPERRTTRWEDCWQERRRELLDDIQRRYESTAAARKAKKRDTGIGTLISTELVNKSVKYTIRRDDGSFYEFYASKDAHEEYSEEYGNLLGRRIGWSEEYYTIED